jgi:hypothetical protein
MYHISFGLEADQVTLKDKKASDTTDDSDKDEKKKKKKADEDEVKPVSIDWNGEKEEADDDEEEEEKPLPMCKYGENCFRKQADHFKGKYFVSC